jgi:outer membrane protein TolC
MKQFPFFCFFTSVICYITINASIAQASEIFTLHAALTQAVNKNRQILATDSSIDIANARLKQARAARLPQVSLQSSALRSNAPMTAFGSRLSQQSITAADFVPSSLNYPTAITQYQSRVVVEMPIYRGGALSAAVTQAQSQQQARHQQKNQTQQQIMYQVIAAYSDVLRANHAKRVAQQAVKAAQAHVSTAKNMLSKGMVLRSDVMDAEVHQLNAAVLVMQAENRIQDAKDRLRALLAMPMNTPLTLAAWSGFVTEHQGDSTATWLARGWQHRPELQQMQAQHHGLTANVLRSKAAFKPNLGLQVTQEWNNNTVLPQHGNTTVMATMRWNVFSGGADQAALQAAQAAETQQTLLLDDMRQSIAVEIKHALRQQTETASRWQVRQQAVQQAQESLRIHSLRFVQGMENINTMLDAQTRVDAAAEAVVQARFDHQMANVQLLLSSGTLEQAFFKR